MKKTALFLPIALFVASCGSEVTVKKEGTLAGALESLQGEVESLTDEMNEKVSEMANSFEVPAGSRAWNDFVVEYNEGFDMFDGNTTWDGKEVTLTGVVEKVMNYTHSDGNQYAQLCFGITDDFMGKNQLSALLPFSDYKTAKEAKKSGTPITFTGKVRKKKFDEIVIESATKK